MFVNKIYWVSILEFATMSMGKCVKSSQCGFVFVLCGSNRMPQTRSRTTARIFHVILETEKSKIKKFICKVPFLCHNMSEGIAWVCEREIMTL